MEKEIPIRNEVHPNAYKIVWPTTVPRILCSVQ